MDLISHMNIMASQSTEKLLEYKMNYKRRGLALIFNQEKFYWELKLNKRFGTTKDKENLTERFQNLGFDVDANDDLNKEDMMKKIREVATGDHSEADCFVCVFLSHGEDGHIFARDDKVNIKDITTLFRGDTCQSLIGKPKIFIFQACRGNNDDNAVTPMGAAEEVEEVEEEPAMVYTLPAEADFLMCYCVAEGFQAYRNTSSGSLYIQDLCETLRDHGSTLEVTELLTLVNQKVSGRSAVRKDGRGKQQPCFTSMLNKRLYFRPKEESTTDLTQLQGQTPSD
ncbi:caspase-6-like [Brachyhypopomus gauderio]|uniref:caspase-6-like n=1 Tax=Brachyhypopomus gauderio TaxID=698409 RepID=UPI0040416C71